MERHEAWAAFASARAEVQRCIDVVEDVDTSWSQHVIALDEALAELHRACCSFEDGGASEEHEDVYLPLFDALSYVTTARNRCKGRGTRTELVRLSVLDVQHARDTLDEAFSSAIPY